MKTALVVAKASVEKRVRSIRRGPVFVALLVMLLLILLPLQSHARHRNQQRVQPVSKQVLPVFKSSSAEPVLKVKLGSLHAKLSIKFPEGGQVVNSRGRRIKTLRKNEIFSWALASSGKKKRKIEHNGETLFMQGGKPILEMNGKLYRGSLQVSISDKGAKVINHVGIESYLRGVVGSEIGSKSPSESLKAQTVIARTYAYASRGKHGADGADVCDSTHCQVYSGVSAERDTINPAISGTQGIVMISDGEPIATLYHATCGGMTSDNDKVYGGAPRSYLRRVICPFCKAGSNYRWSRSISMNELKAALRSEKVAIDQIQSVEIESPAYMDRAGHVIFHTNRGTQQVKGTTFRSMFNLPSTTFVVGNRKLDRQVIADTSPESSTETLRAGIASTCLTEADGAPQQLLIQTARGLKRSPRPADGWHIVSFQVSRQSVRSTATLPVRPVSNKGPLEKVSIFGRGYGHQVGLCQSGAIELGKRNWTYRQILAFYYSNVALRSLDY